jgi:hypothetical protein
MLTIIKRIRQAFGISAPQMRVKTQLAWYWRALAMVVFAAFSLSLAAWIYDAGRRFAGFDRRELDQELSRLQEAAQRLENENLRLSAMVSAAEARWKIEQAAQMQLGKQVKSLEDENRRLKENLAFFENLGPASDKLAINRFTVQPDVLPGEYRYRLLVVMGGARRDRQFHGSLQLVLNVQGHGHDGPIVLPDATLPEAGRFRLNFKHFQRVEGTFRIPEQTRLHAVQARVLEHGSSQALATQSVDMS